MTTAAQQTQSLAERAVAAYRQHDAYAAATTAELGEWAKLRLADRLEKVLDTVADVADMVASAPMRSGRIDDVIVAWGEYLWMTSYSTINVKREGWQWFHPVRTLSDLGQLENRWRLQQAHQPGGGLHL